MKIKMKWCGFHKRMEPIDNFHKDCWTDNGMHTCCKKVQIERVQASQNKKYPYRNLYQNLRNALKRGDISKRSFEESLSSLKIKYGVR